MGESLLLEVSEQQSSGTVRQGLHCATVRLLVLLLALTWWLTVIARLSTFTLSPDRMSEVLRPGQTLLPDARIRVDGSWVEQLVGADRFLATRSAGDSLSFRFVGTGVAILVRTGPDAGRVIFRIDQVAEPSEITLTRSTTRKELIVLKSYLFPTVHEITVVNETDHELAIMGIVVESRPAIWWAFVPPLVVGLVLGAFLLRSWWIEFLTYLGWWQFGGNGAS